MSHALIRLAASPARRCAIIYSQRASLRGEIARLRIRRAAALTGGPPFAVSRTMLSLAARGDLARRERR
jgi:hypothetical protein